MWTVLRKTFRKTPVFWLIALALLMAGCSRRGDGRLALAGSVRLDGVAVERGTIAFTPVEGPMLTTAGAMILGGRYTVPAPHGLLPGRYQVRVFWPQVEGAANLLEGRMGPPPRERIPKRYNSESKLTVEVRSNTDNQFDFELATSGSGRP